MPRSLDVPLQFRGGEAGIVHVIDDTGRVRRTSLPVNPPVGDVPITSAINPDGLPSVVRVAWHAGPCLSEATIRIRGGDPLVIEISSGAKRCSPDKAVRYVVDLEFDQSISAEDLVVEDVTPR